MYAVEKLNELKNVLYCGVLADILDQYNVRHNVMRNDIRPLTMETKVFGYAFTVLAADVFEEPAEPYKYELEAIDNVKEGEVMIVYTNGSTASGFWGELLSTCAARHGCVGAIIDGMTRDAAQIIKMGFQVFARGFCAYDSKGRTDVIQYQVPVQCGDVLVNPGDLIFGDIDGVVVIPGNIAEEVIEKALQKIEDEDRVRIEFGSGANAADVFNKYGIL